MSAFKELTFDAVDRILVLAPHPDDETIATGGVIQMAVEMGLPLRVIWLTYGDNAETAFMVYRRRPVVKGKAAQQMGLLRHDEGVAAAGVLGMHPEQLTFLGYPDFRTLLIWSEHWGDCEPCTSMFTRTNAVPYANALRPGAPYRADEILVDIKQVLREFKPTKIFVSHPGDHNPDHLALYLFTRVALWDLSHEGALEQQPELYPFLVHHPAWPEPQDFNPGLPLEPPARLEHGTVWHINHLTPAQVDRKAAALQKHQTQVKLSAAYLNSFIRANELFGDFPEQTLQQGDTNAILGSKRIDAGAIPAQLTHSERAKWVGVERRAVWLDGDSVVISVDFSRPLGTEAGAVVYLFGYRPDRPFAQMPKLQVRLTQISTTFQDQSRRLTRPPIEVSRGARGFVLRTPLSFLGDPRWIMGNVRTYFRKVPLDWIAWRILEVP